MQPEIGTCVGLTLFTEACSLVSRASSHLIKLAILVSVAIDDSMEWRTPFEEMRLLFQNLSGVGSYWIGFFAKYSNKSHS